MRSDLISREVLLSEYDNNFVRYKDFRDFLENVPDVEIRDSLFVNGYAQGYEKAKAKFEIPQGEWIPKQLWDNTHVWVCSECGNQNTHGITVEKACWKCGAKMKGGAE